MSIVHRIGSTVVGVAVVAALAGCGADDPRWGAVDEMTCADLDLAGLVASAFPDAEPATTEATAQAGGTTGAGASLATCTADVQAGGSGRLAVVVEISSSGEAGENSLYALRDGGELSVAGARVEADPESVDGWWEEGVRIAASSEPAPPVASVVHLTVRDDNLVVAVQVSDWRGSELTEPDADTALADAVVAGIPDVLEAR